MAVNSYSDDFDDFFDTHRSEVQGAGNVHGEKEHLSVDLSWTTKKQGESISRSDHNAGHTSDSVTDSESEFRNKKQQRLRRRSPSSSRSGGSYSSDNSYSSTERRSRAQSRQMKGSHSRSRSYSSSKSRSRSRSRTASPDVATQVDNRMDRKSKRRYSNSPATSSDSYPDFKALESDRERHSISAKKDDPKDTGCRQAWNTEADKKSKRRHDRVKSSKQCVTDDRPPRRGHSKQRHSKRHSENSESDMTDVSPISSPRNDSINSHDKGSEKRFGSESDMSFKDGGDSSTLDFNMLLNAVKEMEKQTRVQSNTRRVMFEPHNAKRLEKSNYTFNSDETHRIEQENQRLLHQIMHTDKDKRPQPGYRRLQKPTATASAVNRCRDHQRIESENLAFLRRLKDIRPSRGISRNEQLSAYNSTVLHGIPVADMHTTITSHERQRCKSATSSQAGSLGRTRSLTSVHSAATASSHASTATSHRSRLSGSRPCSAKKSVTQRPAWDDRW